MEHTEILMVAFALAGVTYYLAGLMMTLQKEEWVAWGYTMRNDSIIAMVAIGSVSAIQVLLEFVQNIVSQSTGSTLILPNQAIVSILAQLVTLDVALVGLVAIVSAVPFLAGFSIVLGHITGPAISTVTGSILLWTSVQLFTQAIPTLFLTLFSIGLVMWSLPFRIGRSAGSTMMALSMVLFVGLPLAAPTAVWLHGQVIDSNEMDQLIKTAQSLDPNIISSHFTTDFLVKRLAEHLTRVIGGIIIAYIIFPILYFALLALFTKAIANLIGGSARLISFGRLGLHG